MSELLKSRVFWVALLALVVVMVSAYVPGWQIDVEHTAGLAVIVAVYLVSYALSPADELKPMLTSRKFWASLLGFIYVFLDAFHVFPAGLDLAQLAGLLVVLCAYIFMVAMDPGKGWRGLLQSRKFWLTVVGLVMVFLDAYHVILPAGMTSDQIVSICVILGGVIAGIGIQGPLPLPLPDPVIPDDVSEA